jgi:hypothetical protein
MMVPPLPSPLLLAALAIVVVAGFADWTFLLPDDPLGAFLNAALAGGSARVALLPFFVP